MSNSMSKFDPYFILMDMETCPIGHGKKHSIWTWYTPPFKGGCPCSNVQLICPSMEALEDENTT
ncbi:hypothetical protein ACFLZ6_00095 [Nanoarchaeota archaeon]